MNRRDFMQLMMIVSSFSSISPSAVADDKKNGVNSLTKSLVFGDPEPFDYEKLLNTAKELCQLPWQEPHVPNADFVSKINYDAHNAIKFPRDKALYSDGPGTDRVTFFHLGEFFKFPVKIHSLIDGVSREISYKKGYFDIPEGNPANGVEDGAGFAGFRVHHGNGNGYPNDDWFSFLGASYFRSCGDGSQYGASARGLAVNPANPVPPYAEEFPSFTRFWIEPVKHGKTRVLALLEGPSVVGAFEFDIRHKPTIVFDVRGTIHIRREVHRLCFAPITSMYWYSKTMRWVGTDWRPEVHDSDGVAMINGRGEKIWRPLNNPPHVMVSAFSDINPRGFGLIQRDRNFEHYLDEIKFNSRPNVWVVPKGNWGKGSVQLLELPTFKEYEDNIGLFWVPDEKAVAGSMYSFEYEIHWSVTDPFGDDLATVSAVRLTPGRIEKTEGSVEEKIFRDFVFEFKGKSLVDYKETDLIPVIEVGGEVDGVTLEIFPSSDQRRLYFRLMVHNDSVHEMRVFLKEKNSDIQISETCLYQYHPRHHMM